MVKVICSHCGYEWKTDSIKIFITCPSCQLKTRREHVNDIIGRDFNGRDNLGDDSEI